jgi:hypothetical protein
MYGADQAYGKWRLYRVVRAIGHDAIIAKGPVVRIKGKFAVFSSEGG